MILVAIGYLEKLFNYCATPENALVQGSGCHVQGEDKGYQVCKKKMDTNAEMLCLKGWPSAFRVFMEAVLALKYDEDPKYEAYMALFRPLTGHGASRPLTIFPVEEPPPKKVRGLCPIALF